MGITKLPPEVLFMIGTFCTYEDLNNIIRTNRYLRSTLQFKLEEHKDMVERYYDVNILNTGFEVSYDADLHHYTHPLFVLAKIWTNSLILDYMKHLKLGRLRNEVLRERDTRIAWQFNLKVAATTVYSSEEFWTQLAQSSSAAEDIVSKLKFCKHQVELARSVQQPPSRAVEYDVLPSILLLVLPNLRHLELLNGFMPWSLSHKIFLECMEVKTINEHGGRNAKLPFPAFHNLTRLTVHDNTTRCLLDLAELPCIRRLDCYDFVEYDCGGEEQDWSRGLSKGVEPPWQQVFFYNSQIPPARLKTLCASLKNLVRMHYIPRAYANEDDAGAVKANNIRECTRASGIENVEKYFKKFKKAAPTEAFTKSEYVIQLNEVEGESGRMVVVVKTGAPTPCR